MTPTEPITAEMELRPSPTSAPLVLEHAALSDRGLRRPRNEDAYLADPPVFAVADGMGGTPGGDVAARLAIEALATAPVAALARTNGLATAAQEANARIHAAGETVAAYAGMGTTLTAAAVLDGRIQVAHVGDSRLYRLRGGRLERLTRDHTFVDELVRRGRLPRSEARAHPWRSILSRALGLEPDVEVDAATHGAAAGDVYLLSSDGLTKALRDEQIRGTLARSPSLAAAARALVEAANAHGGRDNVTVVMFRLGALPSAPLGRGPASRRPTSGRHPRRRPGAPASSSRS
jgi:protein phosphatase